MVGPLSEILLIQALYVEIIPSMPDTSGLDLLKFIAKQWEVHELNPGIPAAPKP